MALQHHFVVVVEDGNAYIDYEATDTYLTNGDVWDTNSEIWIGRNDNKASKDYEKAEMALTYHLQTLKENA
jgi:hypothetical protein